VGVGAGAGAGQAVSGGMTDVEFTDTLEVGVVRLNNHVNELQDRQLVLHVRER
jgi:hypothetical protein